MFRKSFLLTLLLLPALFTAQAQSCMLQPVPLEQRVNTAEVVIEGKLVRKSSYWNQAHTQILTANFIEVYKVFKGTAIPDTVAFVVQGGQVGLNLLVVNPGIELETGRYGLFTLAPLSEDYRSDDVRAKHPNTVFFRDNAWSQSFIAISDTEVQDIFYPMQGPEARQQLYNQIFRQLGTTGYHQKKAYVPAFSESPEGAGLRSSAILSFSPATIAAGTLSSQSILTVTGSGFGATQGTGEVQFKNANNGGTSYIPARTDVAGEYISWTDTEIKVRVPSGAGTGTIQVVTGSGITFTSSTNLTVVYNASSIVYNAGSGNNRYEPDLVNRNGSGGYTLTYNSGFYSNTNAVAAFRDALKNWVHRTGVNFTDAGPDTSTIATNASGDGVNIITFTTTGNGTLGVSYSYYSGCFSGSNLNWHLNDVDMVFNSGVSWYYGCDATAIPAGSYDFESVAVHELGHHHQLGHIIDQTKVMHFNIGTRQVKRAIQPTDKDGGDYVISHSIITNACGPGRMTTTSGPAPNCAPVPLPVELVSFTARPDQHNQVKLTWTTATEQDNSHFTIERSTNGHTFEAVLQVPGSGNSSRVLTYSATDSRPHPGTSYYRLKQTDFDGQFAYSKIEAVNLRTGPVSNMTVYPNPARNTFSLDLQSNTAQTATIRIRDVSGKTVHQSEHQLRAGPNTVNVTPGRLLPAGLYVVEAMLQETAGTARLVIE